MNSALGSQSAANSEARKRRFREIDHNARRKLTIKRLEEKGHSSRQRAEIEQSIQLLLEQEPLTCDLLLSLFSTSLFNYRRSTICDPFPEDFTKGEDRNYEDAETYTGALPPMHKLRANPAQLSNLPVQALKLLSFVVDTAYHDEVTIRQISLADYKKETSNIDSLQSKHSDPTMIFKLEYSDSHLAYADFQKKKEQHGTVMGFHGSPFENFHSIVRSGLDASFGKESSLFGDGIYLSSDRDVAFSFLKSGPNLSKQSTLGAHLGCLVCAEVARKPKSVRLPGSLAPNGEPLPKGYIVAEDNDCVLIKYILLYKDFKTLETSSSKKNVCLYIAVFYVLLLFGLWLLRSTTARQFYSTHFYGSSSY